jgi:hypothetical protein
MGLLLYERPVRRLYNGLEKRSVLILKAAIPEKYED